MVKQMKIMLASGSINIHTFVEQSVVVVSVAREGMIIECPLNDLFHNFVTLILTSQMGVSEMVVNIGNVVTMIYGIIHSRQTVYIYKHRKCTIHYTWKPLVVMN